MVRERATTAVICLDAFDLVAWAIKAWKSCGGAAAEFRYRGPRWFGIHGQTHPLGTDQKPRRPRATNTHLRALPNRANGFHTPEALNAQGELARGGLCPAYPAGQRLETRPQKQQ